MITRLHFPPCRHLATQRIDMILQLIAPFSTLDYHLPSYLLLQLNLNFFTLTYFVGSA